MREVFKVENFRLACILKRNLHQSGLTLKGESYCQCNEAIPFVQDSLQARLTKIRLNDSSQE